MTTIVTRAGKGSALTWTEGDANIVNLNNDKIEAVVEDTTPQLGGDLDANGNRITALKYRETVYEQLSASGTLTIDPANGNSQYIEIAGNITINGLANAAAGDSVTLVLDNLGAYTLTSTMLFAGGVNTITDSGVDVLSIFTPDGVTFFASLAQDFQ